MKIKWFLTLSVLFSLSSCITVEPGEEINFYKYLPQKEPIYGYLDGKANTQLIEDFVFLLGANEFLKTFISDRTEHILFSFNTSTDAKTFQKKLKISILLLGGFSPSQINIALSNQPQWIQKDVSKGWWADEKAGIHIASPVKNTLFVAFGDFDDKLLSRFNETIFNSTIYENDSLFNLLKNHDISFLITDFSIFDQMIKKYSKGTKIKIPSKWALFTAMLKESQYNCSGQFSFKSVKEASIARGMYDYIIKQLLYKFGFIESKRDHSIKMKRSKDQLKVSGVEIEVDEILALIKPFLFKAESH